MGRGRDVSILSIFFLLSLGDLSGCTRWEPERDTNILHLRLVSNPTTLDPAYVVDVAGGTLAAKFYNGLIQFDPDLSLKPDIAQAWEISDDYRAYTFHLRSDVVFTNGQRVSAEDFKQSFERVLSPKTHSPSTWVLERIVGAKNYRDGRSHDVPGIQVLDAQTLRIQLEAPFAPFLGLLAMPAAFVVPTSVMRDPTNDLSNQPVGTGPYRLKVWKQGDELFLEKNPRYFGTPPKIRGIRYRIIPEDLTAVAEFEGGGLDVLAIPAAEYRRYRQDPRWSSRIQSRTGLNTYYLGLNCSRPPLSDVRVRQAIAMAIDRDRILQNLYDGRGDPARGPVPPALWRMLELPTGRTTISSHGLDRPPVTRFDPMRAREFLRSAGFPHGLDMTITISPDPEVLDIVEVIQDYLQQIGIRVTIQQLEWSAFKAATSQGKTDAFYLSWWADYPDPENFLFPVFHSSNRGIGGNRSFFSDPSTDRFIEKAQASKDPLLRSALYHQAEDRVVEQSPWVFLWHKKEFVVTQPWVERYPLFPLYVMDKGLEVSLSR